MRYVHLLVFLVSLSLIPVVKRICSPSQLRHKRNCHLERLKKIKTRSAGSSKTLDNTTPESLLNQMIQLNPRKAKIKEDTAVTIQRENRYPL